MKKCILLVLVFFTVSFFSCTEENLINEHEVQIEPSNDGKIKDDPEEETGEE